MTPAPIHAKLRLFTTEPPMENFNDFVDLEAEIYDWQDDILVPADDVNEETFLQFVNSKFDFWNYYV